MKKKILVLLLALPLCYIGHAQKHEVSSSPTSLKPLNTVAADGKQKNKSEKIYDVNIDANAQIDEALEQARESNRYVLTQVGGNWCPWCIRFAQFADTNMAVNKVINENFVYIHVNTSKENKNIDAMKRLGNPGRFGYPVFVILDREGNVLHIQNSAYLEENKGYSEKKVVECFSNWTEKAIHEIKE